MRFSIIAIATPLLLAGSALAGYNCKCQDGNGQYNIATHLCCGNNPSKYEVHYDDANAHACMARYGNLDNGAFVACCQDEGHGGAYCWK